MVRGIIMDMNFNLHNVLSLMILAVLLGCEPIKTSTPLIEPDTTRAIVIPSDCSLAMSEKMTREYLLQSAITNISPTADSVYDERICGFVDLNNDGVDDLILSNPLSQEGTGGNGYALILAEHDHFRHIGDIAGNDIFVECAKDEPTTVWAYSHSSASSGSILATVIEYDGRLILTGRIPVVLHKGSIGMKLLDEINSRATVPVVWKQSKTVKGIVHW